MYPSFLSSTFDRMLQRGPTGNPDPDWMSQSDLLGSNPPTPGTSRQMMHPDVGVGSGLLRGDTLDQNPGFINPHDLNSGQGGSNEVSWVTYPGNDQVSPAGTYFTSSTL